jgi:hypothetical protein
MILCSTDFESVIEIRFPVSGKSNSLIRRDISLFRLAGRYEVDGNKPRIFSMIADREGERRRAVGLGWGSIADHLPGTLTIAREAR